MISLAKYGMQMLIYFLLFVNMILCLHCHNTSEWIDARVCKTVIDWKLQTHALKDIVWSNSRPE